MTRPWGDLIGPIPDGEQILSELREGMMAFPVLSRTMTSLIVTLQRTLKPNIMDPVQPSDAEQYEAKRILALIVEVYREALERKVRS
jgi:hypothetical protein